MSLSEWADIATVMASILAVLGLGWLVFIQIKRHRQVREDLELLKEQWKESSGLYDELMDALIAFVKDPSTSHTERIERYVLFVLQHLNYVSSQLNLLHLVGMAEYLRKHVADEEVASLLAEWKLRSPITRQERQE